MSSVLFVHHFGLIWCIFVFYHNLCRESQWRSAYQDLGPHPPAILWPLYSCHLSCRHPHGRNRPSAQHSLRFHCCKEPVRGHFTHRRGWAAGDRPLFCRYESIRRIGCLPLPPRGAASRQEGVFAAHCDRDGPDLRTVHDGARDAAWSASLHGQLLVPRSFRTSLCAAQRHVSGDQPFPGFPEQCPLSFHGVASNRWAIFSPNCPHLLGGVNHCTIVVSLILSCDVLATNKVFTNKKIFVRSPHTLVNSVLYACGLIVTLLRVAC